MSKLAVFAAISCLSLAVIPVARSAVIDVTVGGVGVIAFTPNQVQANVGDIIQFTFKQKNHTVTQSSFQNPCTPLGGGFDSGFVPVDADETDFPIAQLKVKDTNPIWAFCKQANHCSASGMVFAVNPGDKFAAFQAAATGSAAAASVSASATPSASVPASSPSSAPAASPSNHIVIVGGSAGFVFTPSNITAQPGDTITFQFQAKNHTVTASSFDNPCQPLSSTSTTGQLGFDSGFMVVSPNATEFPTFTVQVNDTKPIWGYCRQTGHCGMGMVFSVNSVETGPNTFAAFKAKAIQLNGTSAAVVPSGTPAPPSGGAQSTRAGPMMVLVALVIGLVL